ncbi:MAG: hypothetical protein WCS85_05635 [Candidatus Peribacteraceae bacterium]
MATHKVKGPENAASEGQAEYGPGFSEIAEATGKLRHAFGNVLMAEADSNPEWEVFANKYGKYPALVIDKGRTLGVPESQIQAYAFSALQRETLLQNYGVVARLMKNKQLGTPELISFFEGLDHKRQEAIQAERARKLAAEELQSEQRYLELPPASQATVDDLLAALDGASEELSEMFAAELEDIVDTGICERLIGMALADPDRQKKLTDFLGMEREDIVAYLPIRFAPGRGKERRGKGAK